MKKLFFLLFLFPFIGYSQSFEWANSMGSIGIDRGISLSVSSLNSVYLTGNFEDTVDFDPDSGIFNLISNGLLDVFIQKLDVNGDLIWAKSIGGLGGDIGQSIITDDNDNIYLAGEGWGTIDFDPGIGVFPLTISSSFLLKLDSSGNFLWVKEPSTNSGISCIHNDKFGNIIITGIYNGIVDFDPGPGTYFLDGGGIFIQKLDTNGNFIWAKSIDGYASNSWSVTTDMNGNIYTTGYFSGVVDFDPDTLVYNPDWFGDRDIFIQKLDSMGVLIWVKTIGGGGLDEGHSMVVDNSENIYVTGSFQGTVDFNPSLNVNNLTEVSGITDDIFVLKLDVFGNFIWAYSIGGIYYDTGTSITIDDSQSIFITGEFSDVVDFDPGTGVSYNGVNGKSGLFVQKIDTTGNLVWVITTENISGIESRSIITDMNGNIYVAGWYFGLMDFKNGDVLSSNGSVDAFVCKIGSLLGFNMIDDFTSKLIVYPNPAIDKLILDTKLEIREISIIDFTGRIIQPILPSLKIINISELSKGIYYIRLTTNEGVFTKKFVKL